MCRRKHLWGWALMAFGLGLLLGQCLSSSFFQCCLGVGSILIGFFLLRQN